MSRSGEEPDFNLHSFSRAKGLQSSIQLMGEKDLYDYWSDTFKVHSLEWNRDSAAAILSEWQTKFSQEVASLVTEKKQRKYEINAFSSSYLNDTLAQFSEVSFINLLLGVVFMLIYVSLTLFKKQDLVKSQVGLGLSTVLLVVLSLAGGLGCCALLGIHFNASTTQIIPFLALGLGVNSMFHMMPTYASICSNSEIFNEVSFPFFAVFEYQCLNLDIFIVLSEPLLKFLHLLWKESDHDVTRI